MSFSPTSSLSSSTTLYPEVVQGKHFYTSDDNSTFFGIVRDFLYKVPIENWPSRKESTYELGHDLNPWRIKFIPDRGDSHKESSRPRSIRKEEKSNKSKSHSTSRSRSKTRKRSHSRRRQSRSFSRSSRRRSLSRSKKSRSRLKSPSRSRSKRKQGSKSREKSKSRSRSQQQKKSRSKSKPREETKATTSIPDVSIQVNGDSTNASTSGN